MNTRYFYKKEKFERNEVCELQICFDNGDYVTLKNRELKDINIVLSDKLTCQEDAICFVGVDGQIKLSIDYYKYKEFTFDFVYNQKEYNKDRQNYIINRCLSDRITHIKIFNHNSWSKSIYGTIQTKFLDGFLYLFFINPLNEPKDAEKCYIDLNPITKNNIDKIDLDFENCEGFAIYKDDIKEMQLNFKEKLVLSGWNMNREIDSGYILLKIQDFPNRNVDLFDEKPCYSVEQLIYRICYNKSCSDHDICHLYTEVKHKKECIDIDDIRPVDELPEENDDQGPCFVGGYAKKFDNDMVLILFGKEAKSKIEKYNFIDGKLTIQK